MSRPAHFAETLFPQDQARMDVLSEVLKTVRLDGAIFYNAEFSAPWCFRQPASHVMAPYLSSASKHVIIFHLLTEGRGYTQFDGEGRSIPLNAGDIVIFPHGDPHIMGNGLPVKPVDSAEALERVLSGGLPVSRHGGGGEITKLICGYMACEPQLSRVFLGGLPPIVKINIRNDASGQWLEHSIRYSVGQADEAAPGGEAVLAKLSEALFIETLRRYIALLPPEQTGWLAGVRDQDVGKALSLLHRKPAHPWTVASLANEVGVSRSVLADRFRRYLSETPMAYLTRWRLQLGAQLLTSINNSVAQIAAEVGYESEPSFNRAFKREFGLPPARFRKESKSARSKPTRRASTSSRRRAGR
jgi:AraC-like DNA-binding protein